MKLSADFSLEEFVTSETAARMGLTIEPTPEQMTNVMRLCSEALQPIRTALQRPMVVTSGIRPKWLNDAIGGSENSAHLWGGAADVRVIGMSPLEFARWIRQRGFVCDQVIMEFGQWVHIGIEKSGSLPRKQFLTAKKVGNKTVYEELT